MQFLRTLEIKTDMPRKELLATVTANRDRHVLELVEARTGFIDKAKKQLAKRMKQLEEGELVGLDFRIRPPSSHETEYNTVIGMLTDNKSDQVTLTAAEYRMLVEDEWDWMDQWMVGNAFYSPSLDTRTIEKGLK